MGGTVAALGLGGYAAYRAIKKATEKDDDSSSATSTSTSTSTSDSAATGSQQTIYDGMLSEEAVANAKKKKKASAGTMADGGEQTFGGGTLGA